VPKQFVQLIGDQSLFQSAVQLAADPDLAPPVIVTCDAFRFMVQEQLEAVGQGGRAILIKPEARNTAPAVLLAALHLAQTAPDALMLVLPSDQLIRDPAAFRAAVAAAGGEAQAGAMISATGVPVSACVSAYEICSSSRLVAQPENSRSNRRKKAGGRQAFVGSADLLAIQMYQCL
jgi:mannose-1-phosphate guanylyltransferase